MFSKYKSSSFELLLLDFRLLALERLTIRALVLGGIQFMSSHMDGVQSAVVLLTIVELALMNGAFDGFIDLAH